MLKFTNADKATYKFNLFTIEGKLVYATSTTTDFIKLQKGTMQNGMYLYKLVDTTNSSDAKYGKIVIE